MTDFRNQIREDIEGYQENFRFVQNIDKPEWAFNFWVLDKLFFEDEELIESKIIDYNDMGIDAFEFYEDTKELYLIQNKYYNDNSAISAQYVKNDFLIRAITALENGTYTRSEELQSIFSKYQKDSDFVVYLQLFVTNNVHSAEADNYISTFNMQHSNYIAQIFYLDDIKEKYYGEKEEIKSNLTVKIESVNNGTILKLNTTAYKLENVLDARYVLTPVVSIYRMYRTAIEKGYPLFDKNIREYLGNVKTNKGIYKTLMDANDRNNFFYYNNGITLICDTMTTVHTQNSEYNLNASFEVTNPQIVNGCQTVNTIYEVLKNVPLSSLEKDFKDTFVMLKVLVIDRSNEKEKELYENIVKYNNSQNAIDEKTFVANTSNFIRLQKEFENRGFLLLIKQSDKNTFSKNYKTITKLKERNYQRIERFGLNEPKKASDLFVPLEKLLQVINAFADSGYTAYVKKSQMLKPDSLQYNIAINFIQNDLITQDTLLDLFLLYKKAEQKKKETGDNRAPIPYYLIDFFAKYECKERQIQYIDKNLDCKEKILHTVNLYTAVTKAYANQYDKEFGADYNKMIKQMIKYEIVDNHRSALESVIL